MATEIVSHLNLTKNRNPKKLIYKGFLKSLEIGRTPTANARKTTK